MPAKNVILRTRASNTAYVIDQVRELGLSPHPTSRLMQMHRVLSRGHVPYEDPEFSTALEAERDMVLLGFIFDQVQAHRDKPRFHGLVRKLLKDSVLPQKDRDESPGRDSQFEMYLAAVCQNAGLLPLDYEEPDITCTIEKSKFGIAAKRVKSLPQVKKHVCKATKQIRTSNRPGVIALDLSLAWNPKNLPIVSHLESQLYVPVARLKTRQFFDKHYQNIYRWVANSGVLAVVVFEWVVRLRADKKWGLDGMMNWLETTRDDQQAVRDYAIFHQGFLRGVPNLNDLTSQPNWL